MTLSSARAPGMAGPAPLTYPDIAAYSALSGVAITPFMLAALRALDGAFLAAAAEAAKAA